MEQFHNALGMLDLMREPAFCVQGGVIIKVNPAASAFLIESVIKLCDFKQIIRKSVTEIPFDCTPFPVAVGH